MSGNESANRIQGGHLVAKTLAAKGIKRAFALAGGFVNPIYDGLLQYGIETVGTRSEQEAGFLADMEARITRKPSVCIAEPSGFTNYISAVAEAYHARDPVIFISANSISHRWDRMGFKETEQARIVEPITKYSVTVNEGARIPEFLDKAYHIAANDPTGPVQISIPVDFLYSRYDVAEGATDRPFDLANVKTHRPHPDPQDIALVVNALNRANKPVIIAGGAAIWWGHAEKALQELSESLGVPVFNPTWHIKMHDLTHPFNMGLADIHQNPASKYILEESDLVIFVGCSLDYSLDFGEPPLINKNSKIIAVNSSPRELANNHLANVSVLSDVGVFLSSLKEAVAEVTVEEGWAEKIRARRKESNKMHAAAAASSEQPIHPLRLCLDVLHSLNEADYLCIDGGDIYGWLETALNFWALEGKRIGGLIHSGPFDQLGTGVSFATAVKINNLESNVVLICGDGAFGLAPGLPSETAFHCDAPITIVVAKNLAWGMIGQQQEAIWKRRHKTNLRDVPYHKIVEGMGGHGRLVIDPDDIGPAVRNSFDLEVPALIEVVTQDIMSPITKGLTDMRERSSVE